jgi:hypothetical protein
MGNQPSTLHRLNFEDIQEVIKKKEQYILINTLSPNNQSCLLPNTVSCSQEEQIINHYISHNKDKNIVIYGTNVNDMTIYDKLYIYILVECLSGYVFKIFIVVNYFQPQKKN